MEERLDKNTGLLLKKLATVGLPIALQSLIGASFNFVDNIMVGSLGEEPLAAVGIGVQPFFIHWMMLFGFSSGASTYIAQFFGAKDPLRIKRTTGFAVIIGLTIGLIFTAVVNFFPEAVVGIYTDDKSLMPLTSSYMLIGSPTFIFLALTLPFSTALRATQQSKYPMYVSISAFGLNTLLNYVLIFGNFGMPQMGVYGAALATVISRCAETTVILYMALGRNNILKGRLKEYFSFEKLLVKKVFFNAVPTTINETMWGLGTSTFAAVYAHIGVTAYAAFQASSAINSMFTMAGFSIGDAILIIVGQKLGEGKLEEGYHLGRKLLRLSLIFGVIAGALLFITAPMLLKLFTFTHAGERWAIYILRIFSFTMLLSLYNGCAITGVLRCGGDTKFAMISETFTIWFIGVPAAIVGSMIFRLEIYWVVLLAKSEELIKGIILFRRVLSKKWVNNVVNDIKEHENIEQELLEASKQNH